MSHRAAQTGRTTIKRQKNVSKRKPVTLLQDVPALRDMEHSVKGAAKRLLFSLTVLASLGGCAVYDAGYGGYGAYGGVSSYDYYGGPAYPVAPVYG